MKKLLSTLEDESISPAGLLFSFLMGVLCALVFYSIIL